MAPSRGNGARHMRDIVAATDLPVNADFENRLRALTPLAFAESVRLAIATGVAGLSI